MIVISNDIGEVVVWNKSDKARGKMDICISGRWPISILYDGHVSWVQSVGGLSRLGIRYSVYVFFSIYKPFDPVSYLLHFLCSLLLLRWKVILKFNFWSVFPTLENHQVSRLGIRYSVYVLFHLINTWSIWTLALRHDWVLYVVALPGIRYINFATVIP